MTLEDLIAPDLVIKFFKFLEDKREKRIPLLYKLIHKLPIEEEDLYIKGDLDLRYIESITTLPDNLHVKGRLLLAGTRIRHLPKGLKVGRSINMAGTPMEELPDNLFVNGDLNIARTTIKELPKNLIVLGYLYIRGSLIKKLPDDLKVKREIYAGPNLDPDTTVKYVETFRNNTVVTYVPRKS